MLPDLEVDFAQSRREAEYSRNEGDSRDDRISLSDLICFPAAGLQPPRPRPVQTRNNKWTIVIVSVQYRAGDSRDSHTNKAEQSSRGMRSASKGRSTWMSPVRLPNECLQVDIF